MSGCRNSVTKSATTALSFILSVSAPLRSNRFDSVVHLLDSFTGSRLRAHAEVTWRRFRVGRSECWLVGWPVYCLYFLATSHSKKSYSSMLTRVMRFLVSHWSRAFSISGVRLTIWMGTSPKSSLASMTRVTSSSTPVNSTIVTPCMSNTMESAESCASIFLIMLSISNMDKKLMGPLSCQTVFLEGSIMAFMALASSLSAKVFSSFAETMVCMPRASSCMGSWVPHRACQIMASSASLFLSSVDGSWTNSKAFILVSLWAAVVEADALFW
mmetsp:Transcript_22966/g.48889  ORF Transcript_22966/g.48889 Transcript_22966/m.48889 type:complete len:271 (-) Transcript_22966:1976-2788(-)